MRLESVQIKRFRSIEDVSLEQIGSFNVLIGKNNSGKSNILISIDSFFTCLRGGNLVTSDPPIGADIDFCGRQTRLPIEIQLTFSMGPEERQELVQEIVAEAPQMKNAAEGIDAGISLIGSMKIVNRPRRAAFINNIAIRRQDQKSSKPIVLLDASDDVANELISKYVGSNKARRQASILEDLPRRFDPDDWARIKAGSREGPPIRYLLRAEFDPELNDKVERAARQAESHSEFRSLIDSLATAARQEADQTLHQSLKNKIGTFSGEETEVPKYIYSLLKRVGDLNVLYLKERRNPIGENEAKRLLSLKVERGGTQVLQNIQDTVSALLGVKIDAFNSAVAGKGAEMDVDDFLAEVNGSGIREALRLVLDFEFQKPDIFLVEEPEVYLHPSLETSMMRYLKSISSPAQVFITTHSTNFLDTADMKNVYLVSKPKSTKVQELNLEEAETQIPHELGIRLSSLFLFDRLVFVEGPSDEAVLREWAAKLRINFSQVGVGFVHMGGVHNFGYFAAEQTLSFLMKRNVRLWFLIDRDEKEEGEIAKLIQKCGQNAILKVLKRRELENYLIIPRVISEFIGLKRKLAGQFSNLDLPSEPEVVKKIDEVAEQLKALAIDKRVVKKIGGPVFPLPQRLFEKGESVGSTKITEEMQKSLSGLNSTMGTISGIYEEQTKQVALAWKHDKLSVVPGDLLLDGVCRSFGVRFRKETDSIRMATILIEADIDPEIRTILKEIGQAG